ncbi:MAG: hypothetical protein WCG80_12140 [Spirochaetales bacterium]
MSDFRVGELRERTLHRQLKAHFLPSDGEVEVPVDSWVADIVSPSQGIIEIQTGSLAKLRPKLRSFLQHSVVTVIHPVAVRKTIVTWTADRSQVLRERPSPKKERIEALFREIGSLWEFLLHPGFTLVFCLIEEREHRADDGQGSWRRKGVSKVDRELATIFGLREFHGARDWSALLPPAWSGPSTNSELAIMLKLRPAEVQSLTSCYKKLGLLVDVGAKGRSRLLQPPN